MYLSCWLYDNSNNYYNDTILKNIIYYIKTQNLPTIVTAEFWAFTDLFLNYLNLFIFLLDNLQSILNLWQSTGKCYDGRYNRILKIFFFKREAIQWWNPELLMFYVE